MMHAFDVDLPSYHGPLDLLLYLIRREELELESLSLSRITQQYTEFIEVLAELELDTISEFVEIVSVLIEMKAERVLPIAPNPEGESEIAAAGDSPALIERLIQYKRFRDLASVLDEQSRLWQLRYRRLASDLPKRRVQDEEQPIAKIEIWDLVSAFGRILKARQKAPTQEIRYDDTPIHVYMQRIHAQVTLSQQIELQDMFEPGMHKSTLVALFLATLEMTRYHGLMAVQHEPEGPLWLQKGSDFPAVLEIQEVEMLNDGILENSILPMRPR